MLTFRIALRYLFSRKTHNAVNVISIISVLGVAVATMAIVVVLSVFNGFYDIAASNLSAFDPQLKVSPLKGKVIPDADSLCAVLRTIPGVKAATPVLQERALLIAGDTQSAVVVKGIPADYTDVVPIDSTIIDGQYYPGLVYEDTIPLLVSSVGVATRHRIRPDGTHGATLFMPRRVGRINPANPASAFSQANMALVAVFRVNQSEYDTDHVLAPLSVVRDMLDYTDGEASSIDIALLPTTSPDHVKAAIASAVGSSCQVLDRMQQQADSFRMISIEKWVTFAMLAFILVIASFNIISTLSLLVIEKGDNIATMRFAGMKKSSVTSIFVWQGWLISVAGGIIGVVLGVCLSLLQQYGRIIKLAADPSMLTIDAYPVRVSAVDVAVVLALVILSGTVTSQITRLFLRKYK